MNWGKLLQLRLTSPSLVSYGESSQTFISLDQPLGWAIAPKLYCFEVHNWTIQYPSWMVKKFIDQQAVHKRVHSQTGWKETIFLVTREIEFKKWHLTQTGPNLIVNSYSLIGIWTYILIILWRDICWSLFALVHEMLSHLYCKVSQVLKQSYPIYSYIMCVMSE